MSVLIQFSVSGSSLSTSDVDGNWIQKWNACYLYIIDKDSEERTQTSECFMSSTLLLNNFAGCILNISTYFTKMYSIINLMTSACIFSTKP